MPKLEVSHVREAAPSDRSRCLAALVTAFTDDPLLRWMLPDPKTYLDFFPQVVGFYGGRAFEHDSAFRTDDFAAAALWLPPGVGPDEEAMGGVMERAVDSTRLDEVFGLLEQVSESHPEEPHWFLPAIGVDPRRQGSGYGSALLTRSLELCDRTHTIAYLEASNPRNVPLYQRFGFEILGEIQQGSSPIVIPMLRPAQLTDRHSHAAPGALTSPPAEGKTDERCARRGARRARGSPGDDGRRCRTFRPGVPAAQDG